jgi:hypothetical protein
MEITRIEETAMLERTCRFKGLFSALAAAFLLAGPAAAQTARVQDKADHNRRLWETSGHADKNAEAFNHWNADGSIPTTCAKCHSPAGFRDYLGVDGSTVNKVDQPAPIGHIIECEACHADPEKGILYVRTYVIFPSGEQVTALGPQALCMECHQGRASTGDVDTAIAGAALANDDTPSSKLRFVDIHYFAAAATQFGTVAHGGYEYAGQSYDARFAHIPGYNDCTVCHNPHSLKVDLQACNTCHVGVKDPKDIRFYGSMRDYNGNGNYTEGMYYEIETFRNVIYDTLRSYARQVVGQPIAYAHDSYPYFFNDKNDNGIVDSSESDVSNAYSSFSARSLRAAYNLQFATQDPNNYAHNGKYVIELLYDSIQDLKTGLGGGIAAAGLARPVTSLAVLSSRGLRGGKKAPDLLSRDGNVAPAEAADPTGGSISPQYPFPYPSKGLLRVDEGHFDGSAQPWRHFDSAGVVEADCSKCHSPEGLPYLLQNGVIDKPLPIGNGLLCATCHTVPPLNLHFATVTFPSGVAVDLGDPSNLCLNCHQGRASKSTVDETIAGGPGPYIITNIHYYAAAASFFGSQVHGGYEFPGKAYKGRNLFPNHLGLFTDCIECHMGTKSFNRKHDSSDMLFHNVQAPNPADCVYCHGQDVSQPHPGADPAQFEFTGIRPAQVPDLNGNGNTQESLYAEIQGLNGALYAELQAYGRSIGKPMVYSDESYPYFFNDKNGNGIPDPSELSVPNQYKFDATMLKSAYNYIMSRKEPCGYIHNYLYIAELLVDSIGNLGGDTSRFTWR